jgi:hypothetical protein
MKLPGLDKLGSVGLVGERKAIALLCLGFYATLFFLIGLSARTEIPEWVPVFTGMTIVYLVAFFAVGAEWFWGRWFATGVGYWGVSMTIMAFVTTRSFPAPLVILGVMHGLIALCLAGEKMAGVFDAKPAWRERWHIDEQGVVRVRRAVTRAASSLPALIMFTLAPRESAGLALGALAIVGLGGLLARRTWGVVALGSAGVLTLVRVVAAPATDLTALTAPFGPDASLAPFTGATSVLAMPQLLGVFAGLTLVAATLPFLRPMATYLRRR